MRIGHIKNTRPTTKCAAEKRAMDMHRAAESAADKSLWQKEAAADKSVLESREKLRRPRKFCMDFQNALEAAGKCVKVQKNV